MQFTMSKHPLFLSHRRLGKERNSTISVASTRAVKELDGKLIKKESVETGNVKLSVYHLYVRAASYWKSFLFFFFLTGFQVLQIMRSFWLSAWSDEYDGPNENKTSLAVRLGVFGGLGTLESISFLLSLVSLAFAGLSASYNLHAPLLRNLLRSPMSFFDTTPLGRILNRCAKDVEVVDMLLPMNFRYLGMCVLQVICTLIVIVISTPIFVVVIVPLAIIYYFFLRFYVPTSRQLKRLESTHRSPIYSHFSETIQGAASVRAFNKVEDFRNTSGNIVDAFIRCKHSNVVSNRWLAIRLEFIGNLVIFFAALFAVISKELGWVTSPGIIGVSITYALNKHGVFAKFVEEYSSKAEDEESEENVEDDLLDLQKDGAISFLLSLVSLAFAGLSASYNLHAPLLRNLLRSPMSFFDTTPLGRILNRCAKDVEVVDMLLPMNFRYLGMCVLQVICTLIVIVISTPIFVVVIVPLAIIYYFFLVSFVPGFTQYCPIFTLLFGLPSQQVTEVLNFAVRQISEIEANIVAVERIEEYTVSPTEAAWEIPEKKPPADWPSTGAVTFAEYSTRYREGLDLVLKGISAEVHEGEKIGIVGRTGAGKSSFALALFRMIEPASGKIIIDNVDIASIGLHDLRGNLTIIPQDPVLFSGTLRFNLDPFGKNTDEEIWNALELANIKSCASNFADGLDHPISEGGENISSAAAGCVCYNALNCYITGSF
ncbi:ABC transporter transmembrane region [Oesophagostomum dentatum]|uniref:ABC transporter transmembrane region n=1 Tax=Oesophagostomum dentatum TaxID=61180 RepID=A0A0B1TC55_OESDE|nr:ABC transporter transmembrane region [Oesophagostomum dentatum]